MNDFKDDDFENKIKNEEISVIQFSAAWCGPCKVIAPKFDELSDKYSDSIFIKVRYFFVGIPL